MRPNNACPTEDELVAFQFGDLPEPVLVSIAEHLEDCSRCEARAQRLDRRVDPVIASLRMMAARQSCPSGPPREGDPGVGADEAPRRSAPIGRLDRIRPSPPGYEVGEILGEGGMGVVYKARHLGLNRVVALKVIASNRSQVSARFRVEAEAAARLQHPNIVQIFEIGDQDGHPFLALEYVEGGSLEQHLAGKPLLPRRAAALLRTLALAADCAHRRGIVHRDLKPSNILLTPGGDPKITDFGIAKRLESEDRWSLDGDIMGTPSYMAPEQASGTIDGVGPATDVYSLGVILYEMLTGRVPHQAATSFETLTLVCEQEPVPPRRLQPKLPRDLETIVLKCLRKEAARRYEDAIALAEDLGRFLSGEPILARPVGPAERAYKWAWRHPALFSLIAVATLGLTASGLVSWRVNALLHWYNAELSLAARLAEQEAERAEIARRMAQDNARSEAEQRRQAEAALYFSRVGLAESEWLNNNVAGADRLLDECLPRPGQADLRGWEWRYLKRLCHADRLTLAGHGTWVHRVAYSPDGGRIVAAAGLPYQVRSPIFLETPGVLNLWDASSGRLITRLEGHTSAAWGVDFSPDGRRIASAGADGTVNLWDAETFQRSTMRGGPACSTISVRFSPDGWILAVGDDRSLSLWSLDERREQRVLHQGSCHALAFSPDGRRLAVCVGASTVSILDLFTGQTIRALQGSQDRVRGVAYSPDGLYLATSDSDGLVVVWDLASGEAVHRLRGHNGESTCVAFSPDARYLASGGADQTVRLWDVGDGSERLVLRGHTFGIRSVAFRPDGERIVSSGQDGAVKVWDVTRDPRGLAFHRPLSGGQWVGGLTFSADATHVTRVDHDRGLLLTWNTSNGIPETERLIDITRQYLCPRGDSAFSLDGRLLAAPSREDVRVIKAWDVPTCREVRTFRGHAEPVLCTAISRDCERIASAGWDRKKGSRIEMTVWSVATGGSLVSWTAGPGLGINRLAFSPDAASLASAHSDGTTRIWASATGRELRTLAGHQGAVNDVAFSPDGRQLASVAHADPTVRIWDVATGRDLFTLRGHNHPLTSVAFSPDGQLVASVGFEGVVKLWDAKTGRDVLTLRGFGPRRPGDSFFNARVVFSRDGTRVASNGWDGRLNVWDADVSASGAQQWTEERAVQQRAFAWHLREADPVVKSRRGHPFGDRFHLEHVRNVEPPDETMRVARGHLFIRLGRWAEADADLFRVLRSGSAVDVRLWYEHACLRLLAGDLEGYHRACAAIAEHHGGTNDPVTASFVARACTVGPGVAVDPAQLVRWARLSQSVAAAPGRTLGLLGAAYYRAGQWDQALLWLTKTLEFGSDRDGYGINQLLLAMIHHRLGHADEARRWLEQVVPPSTIMHTTSLIDATPPPLEDVDDLLAYQLLRSEAKLQVTAAQATSR